MWPEVLMSDRLGVGVGVYRQQAQALLPHVQAAAVPGSGEACCTALRPDAGSGAGVARGWANGWAGGCAGPASGMQLPTAWLAWPPRALAQARVADWVVVCWQVVCW